MPCLKLRTRLFVPLLVFCVLFGAYAHYVWFEKYVSTFIQNHETHIQAHLKTAAEGLIPLILEDRLATIYDNLDALLIENPQWRTLMLYDKDNGLIYPLEEPIVSEHSETSKVFYQSVSFSGPSIGTLTLTIDFADFYANVDEMEKDFIVALSMLLFIIVVSIFTIVEMVVSRPVRAISVASKQISRGIFNGNLPPASSGEVGELVDNFVNMRDSILAYHVKLKGEIDNHKETAQALLEQKELASYQASHDALTGLINRREFERRVNIAIEYSRTDNSSHVLLYIDLDQFKIVNDTCGHIAGDMLLRQLSQLLKEKTRQHDTLGRLGGDEFGLLFEYCNVKDGLEIAEGLLDIAKDFRFSWDEKLFNVGASIGLVEFNSESGNYFDILSAADSACYSAKEDGRNRIKVYQSEDAELSKRKGEMLWTTRLIEALENDNLVLYCQAIESLSQESVQALKPFEVLLRIKGGDGEIIYPDSFISAAERYNLITEVDRWVLKNTFQFMHQYKMCNNGVCNLKLSINISGVSLGEKEIVEYIEDLFLKYKPEPGTIVIEVTETAAIQNLSRAVVFMTHLKKFGCQFSLDDFGSGLSSFNYLKSLPVEFVKIDGGFVCDIDKDPLDLALVKSINEVVHVLGKYSIAEYVTNQEIANILKEAGVDFAQGYHIGKPFPIHELTSQLPDSLPPLSPGYSKSTIVAEVS